jgi:rhodanese-related sulfurtransferase
MQHMSPRQLRDRLADAKAGEPSAGAQDSAPLLLDVREPWEEQVCRIDGSVLIPMREIPEAVHTLDPKRETVVICHHGIRSWQVAYFLEHSGFTKVINLTGGVAAWARDVDPSMPTY